MQLLSETAQREMDDDGDQQIRQEAGNNDKRPSMMMMMEGRSPRKIQQSQKKRIQFIRNPLFLLSLLFVYCFVNLSQSPREFIDNTTAASLVYKSKSYDDGNNITRRQSFAIFYNVYFPDSESGQSNSLRIIEEQLGQIKDANIQQHLPYYRDDELARQINLHYVTIGVNSTLPPARFNTLCAEYDLACHHRGHYPSGTFEERTLQALYEYCVANPIDSVAYIHNKGSFSTYDYNERWRRAMMVGVFHPDCLNPPDDTCNMCGLNYTPIWLPMMVGNFFMVKCSHAVKLIPPMEYGRVNHEMQTCVRPNNCTMTDDGNDPVKFGFTVSSITPSVLGADRVAMEGWVASHPGTIYILQFLTAKYCHLL